MAFERCHRPEIRQVAITKKDLTNRKKTSGRTDAPFRGGVRPSGFVHTMWPNTGLGLSGGPRGYDFQAERVVGKRATEGRIDIAVVDINAVDVFFEACHRFARSEIVLVCHIGLFVAHKAPPHVVGYPLSCQAGLELCPKCVEVLCGCVKPSGLTVMMKSLAHYAAQRVVGLRAGQVRKEAARFRLPAQRHQFWQVEVNQGFVKRNLADCVL